MEKRQIGCAITEKKTNNMCYHRKKIERASVIMEIRQLACVIMEKRQISCVIMEKKDS